MKETKKVYFRAIFTFSEEDIPEEVEEMAIYCYNHARGIIVDITNPMLEGWNNAYTDKVTGEDDMKYNGYISGKLNEVCNIINDKLCCPVKIKADEYAELIGIFSYKGKEIKMHLSLKPL